MKLLIPLFVPNFCNFTPVKYKQSKQHHRASICSGNALDLYSENAWSESQPRYRLS